MWYVYICDRNGKLHTGITTQIPNRMSQNKARLLYFEEYAGKHEAVRREREIKGWDRGKKLQLIESSPASLS